MPNLVKKHSISFELAQKMADTAVAKAKEIGVSENVVLRELSVNVRKDYLPGSETKEDGPILDLARLAGYCGRVRIAKKS